MCPLSTLLRIPIWQFLIVSVGSLALSTPYLAVILGLIIAAWIQAARSLSGQFEESMEKNKA